MTIKTVQWAYIREGLLVEGFVRRTEDLGAGGLFSGGLIFFGGGGLCFVSVYNEEHKKALHTCKFVSHNVHYGQKITKIFYLYS